MHAFKCMWGASNVCIHACVFVCGGVHMPVCIKCMSLQALACDLASVGGRSVCMGVCAVRLCPRVGECMGVCISALVWVCASVRLWGCVHGGVPLWARVGRRGVTPKKEAP